MTAALDAVLRCAAPFVEGAGADDDLFTLGLSSLSAVRLARALLREFGVRLSLEDVFANPTARGIAELLAAEAARAGYGLNATGTWACSEQRVTQWQR